MNYRPNMPGGLPTKKYTCRMADRRKLMKFSIRKTSAAPCSACSRAEEHGVENGDRRTGLRAARDEFYQGSIAADIVAFNMHHDGLMRASDLANYSCTEEDAISVTFGEYTIKSAGPWCQGPVLLQALNILEHFNLKKMGHNSGEYIHTITEALKLAFADREKFFGDPSL